MTRRVITSRNLQFAGLTIALVGILLGCGRSEQPGLSIRLETETLRMSPGASTTLEIELLRSGGFTGAVSLAALGAPSGVSISFEGDPTGSSATLGVAVSEDAETDIDATITVRATGAGLARAPATHDLSLKVVPPTLPPVPNVTIVSEGYGSSRQIRQGAGRIELLVSNTDGLGEYTASLEALTSFGEDVVGEIVVTGTENDRIRFDVPSAAAIGEVSLRLNTASGPVVVPDVLEVTPIVISPAGDDANPGTYDLPLRSLAPESLARMGDRIVLLAGEYEIDGPIVLPEGVSLTGSGDVVLRPTVAGASGLEIAANTVLTDLTLDGFGTALFVGAGDVRIERIQILNSGQTGVRVQGGALEGLPTVRMAEVNIVDSDGSGIEIHGPARVTGSRLLVSTSGGVGIAVTGDAPTVLMSDLNVLRAGRGLTASGIHIDYEGDGLVKLRRSLVSGSSRFGIEVSRGEFVDLGTSTDPGGNVLRENLEGQLMDARPGRPEPDGGVITLVGTRWNGAFVDAGIHTGPYYAYNPVDNQFYWVIENPNNRVETGR